MTASPRQPLTVASLPKFRTAAFRHILKHELPLPGRAVDLGAGHLWFSIMAHRYGLDVTAVDARSERLPPAEEWRGITFIESDIRDFPLDGFDYVFVLGLLYHLTFEDQVTLFRRALTARVLVLDTQVHVPELIREEPEPWETDIRTYGDGYFGVDYPERDTAQASWGNPISVWLTEPSLIRLARDCGYRTVEPVGPVYPTMWGGRRFYVLRP